MTLLEKLISEKKVGYKGGIYHKLQIDFAYNSNHIEGSRLTHEQTRYIFETNTIGLSANKSEEIIRINDIIETVNHFKCFDYIIDTNNIPLSVQYLKELHHMLKINVQDEDAVIGDFKREPNCVGDIDTSAPETVETEISAMLSEYNRELSLYDVAAFHTRYEKIHPFYDGNGRTGRLLMFKQCLENEIMPFYIDDYNKIFYYKGLKEWQTENKDERLINVFLDAQDTMQNVLDYFRIDYVREEKTYKAVVDKHLDNNTLYYFPTTKKY